MFNIYFISLGQGVKRYSVVCDSITDFVGLQTTAEQITSVNTSKCSEIFDANVYLLYLYVHLLWRSKHLLYRRNITTSLPANYRPLLNR